MDILVGSSWPEWLQTISTPAAVLVATVAIWSTFKIERDRRRAAVKDRRLRARGLALAIYPELMELKAKVMGSRSFLDNVVPRLLGDWQLNELSRAKLEVPPTLERSLDEMWLLGEKAASPILQAVSVSSQFDRMVDRWVDDMNKGRSFEPGPEKVLERLRSHLDVVGRLIEEAETAIAPIHDGSAWSTDK